MPYEAKMARMVLEDCRYALTELRNDPQGPAWRIRWFGAVAMLRAVGHVLEKVDAKSCPELKKANDDWWTDLKSTKPNPAIFWQFIDTDRDAILKEYDHRAGQSVTIMSGVTQYDLRTGQEMTVTPGGPTTFTYEIHGGPFDGRDPRDVVRQAIEWWDQELTAIEKDAADRRV